MVSVCALLSSLPRVHLARDGMKTNQCRCVITDLCAGEPCPGPNYVCNPATGACLCITTCGPNQIPNLDCECVGDDGFIN